MIELRRDLLNDIEVKDLKKVSNLIQKIDDNYKCIFKSIYQVFEILKIDNLAFELGCMSDDPIGWEKIILKKGHCHLLDNCVDLKLAITKDCKSCGRKVIHYYDSDYFKKYIKVRQEEEN